jgi:predicted metal-dependent hydrolase
MAQYKDIQYTLKKHNRRTGSIYVERDGRITVLVPMKTTTAEVEDILEEKRKWIYTSLAEWEDLNAARVTREFVNGEGFLYLGRSYRLCLVDEQEEPLLLKGGYFCLCRGKNGGPVETFRKFYREKGLVKITERVHYYQGKMGVEVLNIRVIELQNRWASCSQKGNLNFHWKCVMAPLTIVDYIIVHELAHLIHPNHNPAFWSEVEKVIPDYRERKEWLRKNGAGMTI